MNNADIDQVRTILQRIIKWNGEFPETGRFYDPEKTRPMSYGAAYGSNGERDYMRGLAKEALALLQGFSDLPEVDATLEEIQRVGLESYNIPPSCAAAFKMGVHWARLVELRNREAVVSPENSKDGPK